jgi:ankyrin repeat protein
VNVKNNNGDTALICAADKGHTAIVDSLRARGADARALLPKPKQGRMADVQVTSAEEATEILFDRALSLLQISSLESIKADYEGFERAWGARELIEETREELYGLVFSNLSRTCRLPGFHFFLVGLYSQNRRAEVMTFSDGEGASVCLWRTKRTLHLCGNYYFKNF